MESDMSNAPASPDTVRIGLLIDVPHWGSTIDDVLLATFRMVEDEYRAEGLIDRPIEYVVRIVPGLPGGSFAVVRDAFHELVEEGCLVIYGPMITENGVPLLPYVERMAEVPIVSMAGTESMLGEWVFALNNGSMADEGLVIASVIALDGHRRIAVTMDAARSGGGITHMKSLIGQEYLHHARLALNEVGLESIGETAIPLDAKARVATLRELRERKPDAILHLGLGQGMMNMNAALDEIGWSVPRYTQTSFEAAANSPAIREKLAGWIGLDQYDERNRTGQQFLDRFEARYGHRPETYVSVYAYDMARVLLRGIANAQPLTGAGVRAGLERIKMLKAASGAPGTRIKFGRYMHQGWVGAEYLVARRILADGSRSVLHATIEGLV
jgi:branched-chain amino acid transport system substrate-binding protein